MIALRLLRGYIRRSFLEELTWRGFLITLVIEQAVTPLLGLAVWSSALPGLPDIARYYVAALVIQLLTVSYENHTFSGAIYNGDITGDLVRPQPVFLTTLGTNLSMRIWHVIFGLPLIIVIALVVNASFSPIAVLTAIPAVVLAAALSFVFGYTLALSAFWTQQAMGVTGFGQVLVFLLGGVAAPLVLFPVGVRPIVEVLPFGAMIGFPAEVASGVIHGNRIVFGYGVQVFWTAFLTVANSIVWKRGLRRYSAVGG